MRNLKKVLSLSLALVMLLGMMVVGAGAATALDVYSDANDITYKEAVDLLTAIDVLQGDEGGFRPTDTLTREQAAKIVATIALGVDAAEALTVTKAPFTDVAATRWSAGYIAYCANVGIINGMGDGTYKPTDTVTGYQFAKMLLCCVGYGANDEYVGSNWSLNVAKDGVTTGLFNRLSNVGNTPATRDEAAQLAFNAVKMDMVTYSTLFGTYSKYVNALGSGDSATLLGTKAEKIFNVAARDIDNAYGITYHYWYNIGRSGTAITDTYLTDTILGTVTGGSKGAMYRAYDWDDTVTVIENGITTGTITSASLRNSSAPAAAYAGQTITLIDSNDEDAGVDKMVVTTEYLAKVTRVTAATASAERNVTITAYTPAGDVTATIETEDYAVGDYILVDPAITVFSVNVGTATEDINGLIGISGSGDAAAAAADAAACTAAFGANVLGHRTAEVLSAGTVTAYYLNGAVGADNAASGSVTTGGVRYGYNGVFAYAGALGRIYTVSGSDVYGLNSSTYNFYLDSNGNVIGVTPVETTITDYAYVTAKGTDGTYGPGNALIQNRVNVILSDGTSGSYTQVQPAAANVAVGSAVVGSIYAYSINNAGNIILTAVTDAAEVDTWASNYVTFTKGYTTMIYGASRSKVAYVTENTVFVYYNPTTGAVSRYEGMANAPTISSSTSVTAYTVATSTRTGSVNRYVDYIVLKGTASDVYTDNLYIIGRQGSGIAANGSTVYYYNAVLNGEAVVLAATNPSVTFGTMYSYSLNADAFTGDTANNVIPGLYSLNTAGTNVSGTVIEYQGGVAVIRPVVGADVQIAIPDTADVTDVSANPVVTGDTVTVGDVVTVAYSAATGAYGILGIANDVYITTATTVITDDAAGVAALAAATSGTFTVLGNLTNAVTVPANVTLYVTGNITTVTANAGTINVSGTVTTVTDNAATGVINVSGVITAVTANSGTINAYGNITTVTANTGTINVLDSLTIGTLATTGKVIVAAGKTLTVTNAATAAVYEKIEGATLGAKVTFTAASSDNATANLYYANGNAGTAGTTDGTPITSAVITAGTYTWSNVYSQTTTAGDTVSQAWVADA